MKIFWTPHRIATLTALWKRGISARIIAEKLGGITRNAVIGKAGRLGLSTPHKAAAPKAPPRKQLPTGLKPTTKINRGQTHGFQMHTGGIRSKPYTGEFHKAGAKAITFDALTITTCRFPLGAGVRLEQLFCGKKCGRDDTYCTEHHAICWIPKSSRNDRRNASRDGRIRKAKENLEAEKQGRAVS